MIATIETKDLLLRVLQTFEQENIRYCLLRDGDQLDQYADGGEVDLLVDPRQLHQLQGILSSLGFVRLTSPGHWPHCFFVAYLEGCHRWLKLDVVTHVAYGRPSHALRTSLAAACLANRRRHGAAYIPSPEDELVTLLLHCVLDKGTWFPARQQRLQALCDQVVDEAYVSKLLSQHWSPDMTFSKLVHELDRENWQGLLAGRDRVAAYLAGRDRLGTVGRRARDWTLRKLNRLACVFRPQALSVAVLGPDGAGKSTVVDAISKSFFFSTHCIYMGLYQNGSGRKRRGMVPGLGLMQNVLWRWRNYLTARMQQARGRLVIFDRYGYDALLPAHRRLNRLKRWRRQLLAYTCPAPDLVVVLNAPGEVLFARKGEHNPALLERQRQAYLAMQSHLPQMVVVDATRDADQVCRAVTSAIWNRYAKRFDRSQN